MIASSETAFRTDPYPTYAELRRSAPAYPNVTPHAPTPWTRGTVWYLSRYDDCVALLRDRHRFVKDYRLAFDADQVAGAPPEPEVLRLSNRSLICREGDEHARLRRLVSHAFSPAMVEGMERRVRAQCASLLDGAAGRGLDVVGDYAFPVAIGTLAGVLGLPASATGDLRRWVTVAPPRSDAEMATVERKSAALLGFLRAEIAARRRAPAGDLLSALVAAEVDGDRLDDDALLGMVLLLVQSGYETTANSIANGVLALLRHPAEMERLRHDPALMPTAVEELLRYDPAIQTSTMRWAAEDVTLHGQTIRRGDRVLALIAAANRDPGRFDDPDRLDLGRRDNRHLTFGVGGHYCTGAPLARLEIRAALGVLLERTAGLRLAIPDRELSWRDMPPFRSLDRLPVSWS